MEDLTSPPPSKPKLAPKQRELLSMAIEGGLLVALLAGASWAWTQRHVTVDTRTVVVQGSSKPAPSSSAAPLVQSITGTGRVSSMETLTIPIDSVAPGYAMTMQVPTAWRATDLRSTVLSQYKDYDGGDLMSLLRFVPEHSERNTLYSAVEPVNTLDVTRTTKWAATSDDAPATAANKKAFLAYVASVKSVGDITGKTCVVFSGGGGPCGDPKVKPQVIQTADGSLSGFIFMTMQTQAVVYDPAVEVWMTGTVKGQPVMVYGNFQVYDAEYTTFGNNGAGSMAVSSLSKVQTARNAYLAGNPPADAVDAYNRIVAAVSSMKFVKR